MIAKTLYLRVKLRTGEEGRKREEGQTHRQHAFALLLNELMQCTYKDSRLSILAQMALIVYSAFGIALHYLKIMIHVEKLEQGCWGPVINVAIQPSF